MTRRFSTLRDVERYLAEHTDYEKMARFANLERAFNLDRMRRLLARLGNPQRSFRAVHVAGTKGKGSVSHMIDAVLADAGYATGLFTSPHLVSLRERVRFNGAPAEEADLCRAMEAVAAACDEPGPPGEEPPTFFERMFALSCVAHRAREVRFGVVEVGLGGRLDATNVIEPEACAITTLALDHTAVLGETIEEIAAEKAGILKGGVPAVLAENSAPAARTVERIAAAAGAPLTRVGSDVLWGAKRRTDGGFGIEVDVTTPVRRHEALRIPLAGLHQGGNAAVAVALVDLLHREEKADVPMEAVREGLTRVRVPGRLETVRETPRVIVDVAHNEASIAASLAALAAFHPHERLLVACGFSRDKDWAASIARLVRASDRLFFTTSGTPRSADPDELAQAALRAGAKEVRAIHDFAACLDALLDATGPNDLALITGSFYVAGKAYVHLGVEVG